jgi:hypothetical protein
VAKVAPLDRRSLRQALWALVTDPERRALLRASGRKLAEDRSIDRYASALAQFLADAPRWPWRDFTTRLDRELEAIGVGRDMNAYWRVSEQVSTLLPSPLSAAAERLLK